jgi:predicted outer membrane repeat protein
MDGFFITAGASSGGGGGIQMQNSSLTMVNLYFSGNKSTSSGGGIANLKLSEFNQCNPSLSNVTFLGNTAVGTDGGGMYNDYSCAPELTNVVFEGNIAGDEGGGFFSYSNMGYGDPVFQNVLFSGNSATNGGGIYLSNSNPEMINVTITSNNATGGGGMYNAHSNPTIINTIFWANTASTGSQINNASDSVPTISYSDIQGSGGSTSWVVSLGTDAGNNIDDDPLFVRNPDSGDGDWTTRGDNDYGDLHLQDGSPAVDTGTNTGCPTFDLDGNPRPIGTYCDMGVYERLISIFLPLILR